jgi:FkbM family methyltransferase
MSLFIDGLYSILADSRQYLIDIRDLLLRDLRRFAGSEPWVQRDVRPHRLRLGRGDGRWTIAPAAIRTGGVVYSFGVGKDIGFDLEMIRRFGVDLHAFDPTPISMDWLATQTLPAAFHFHPVGLGAQDTEVLFELPRHHGVSFTCRNGMLREPPKQSCTGQIRRLESLLRERGHDRLTLLKIDIEGSEYDVIDELVSLSDRIDQLLVEFHHRMPGTRDAVQLTRDALQRLRSAGFRVFDVSPRGIEIGLIGPKAVLT